MSLLSDYLSREDLARELEVTLRTVDEWRERKTGPAPTRVGRQIRYKRSTVVAWLESREEPRP